VSTKWEKTKIAKKTVYVDMTDEVDKDSLLVNAKEGQLLDNIEKLKQ
jgi:hypothetical protein